MLKRVVRVLLATIMVLAGITHFTMTASFVQIVPDYLPAALPIVYVSGVIEILLGIGLVIPATRRIAAFALIAFLIAVLPANLYQAMNNIQPPGLEMSATTLWARLPLQLVPILWAWWMTRPDPPRA